MHPDDLGTIRHGTAVAKIAEDNSVSEGQPKSALAPIRRPPSRGGPLHRSAPNAFLFGPCTARFSFGKTKEKWGVHPGWTSPLREQRPCGRRPAARITLTPLVAASQQVIRRHLKVVCQGNQAGHIGIMLCAFIILICPQAYPQVFRHFSLCFFSAFAELFQPPCKKFHKTS